MGKLVSEISGSPHDSRSIMKLAQAVEDLQEQLGGLEKRLRALEKKRKRSREKS